METVQGLLHAAADLPSDNPRRDAEILLCHCLGKDRAWLYTWPEAEVKPPLAQHFSDLLVARRQGTPIAHLTGRREFWSLELEVNAHTLIPRSETETLVEWALELSLPERASVLDLGTGSGAIALALAREREHWTVAGLDASATALAARVTGSIGSPPCARARALRPAPVSPEVVQELLRLARANRSSVQRPPLHSA